MWLCSVLLSALVVSCSDPSRPDPRPTPSPPATASATSAARSTPGGSASSSSTPSAASCPLGNGCPRPEVTPGAVIPSAEGVCTTSYNPRRELTAAAKRRVLAAYGFDPATIVAEWDHLVARWAGGTSTSSNVWPQVWPAMKRKKDLLEVRLYVAVCRGGDGDIAPETVAAACDGEPLDLACARRMMRAFWRWW